MDATNGCGSKIGTQKWLALVNGKKDSNLRSLVV